MSRKEDGEPGSVWKGGASIGKGLELTDKKKKGEGSIEWEQRRTNPVGRI